MKLEERIENLILYAAMCLVKTQADPSFRIINSTGWIWTELVLDISKSTFDQIDHPWHRIHQGELNRNECTDRWYYHLQLLPPSTDNYHQFCTIIIHFLKYLF